MAVLTGTGFVLTTPITAGGASANGTVISGTNMMVQEIQTNGAIVSNAAAMHTGDAFTVDTDNDGSFADETATTQADNDRYRNSTATLTDGSTLNLANVEVVTLSDGTQVILLPDSVTNFLNTATLSISSLTLGTFTNRFQDRYNQANYTNTITADVVCFDGKTLIKTPHGERAIGTLSAGDRVINKDGQKLDIKWIGKRAFSSAEMKSSPNLMPVRISAGALGDGLPHSDLTVSPQHRILLVSKIAKRLFGEQEVLVPAIKLVGVAGIERVTDAAPLTYVHMLFRDHEVVFANGAMAESLYTGKQAMEFISKETREEIFEIFPELRDDDARMDFAYPVIKDNDTITALVARHKMNGKPLVNVGV